MNWHLRSPSQVWVLEEADYLIHLGRRFWNRRDEDGRFTDGTAGRVMRRTQTPSVSMEKPRIGVKGRSTKAAVFDPSQGMSHQAILYKMFAAIDSDGYRYSADDLGQLMDHSALDGTRRRAKEESAQSIAEVAAQDPAVIEAHGRWLKSSGLDDEYADNLQSAIGTLIRSDKLPPFLQRSDSSFEMKLTPRQSSLIRARLIDEDPSPKMWHDALVAFRQQMTMGGAKALGSDSASDRWNKERDEAISEYLEIRDIKPTDPDFDKKWRAFGDRHSMVISEVGLSTHYTFVRKAHEQSIAIDLASDPAFFLEPIAGQMLNSWAESSWNGRISAVMQRLAREEFGIENDYSAISDESTDRLLQRMNEDNPDAVVVLRALIRSMYAITQEMLGEVDGDHVLVYRGVKTPLRGRFPEGDATISMAPMSSWSLDPKIAFDFASTGNILIARVPKERVVSVGVGGIGCLSEYEVVIIGGDLDVHSVSMTSNVVAFLGDNRLQVSPTAKPSTGDTLELVLGDSDDEEDW